MKKSIVILVSAFVCSSVSIGDEIPPTNTLNDDLANVQNRCIVSMSQDISSHEVPGLARSFAARANSSLKYIYSHSIKGFTINMPCHAAEAAFGADSLIIAMEPDGIVSISAKPTNPGGGKGGGGNARFASGTNRAPMFHEMGEPGEEYELQLELKLMADIGIVGLPNAGKSTFLSRVSNATPKIADYPFTTLTPNLGVVALDDYRTLVIADIPGIIEGAAQGKGLGHDFLRHIERTKVLLFFIDPLFQDPRETYDILLNELIEHSDTFRERPKVLAFTKADITENKEQFEELSKEFIDARLISSATGEGVDDLLQLLWETLEEYNRFLEGQETESVPEVEYTYDAPYTISETEDGYEVEGKKVVRAVRMTDFDNEEGLHHLDLVLKKWGLYKALQRMGAQEGDTIIIGGVEMEYRD